MTVGFNPWAALILGLLLGWLIEWVIDWLYWRRRESTLLANVEELQRERDQMRQTVDRAQAAQREAQAQLQQALAERKQIAADGGIMRVALVGANTDNDDVQTELATLREQLNTANSNCDQCQSDLAAARQQLQAATTEREWQQADLGALRPALIRANVDNDQLQDDIATLRNRQPAVTVASAPAPTPFMATPSTPPRRDPLIDIVGIGPVYEQRLNEAGIYTFAQFAQLSPERIREIVKPEAWHEIDPPSWIEQALEFDRARTA